MRSRSEHDSYHAQEPSSELAILSEVSQSPAVTQRELASRAGLSLGATNLLVQTFVRKGYLRMKRAGWRRWLYALTPSGAARKLSLTTNYVSGFLYQYRQVRAYMSEQLDSEALNGSGKVAVYGAGDMVRLVHLVLNEMGIDEVDVYVPDGQKDQLPGMDVSGLSELSPERYHRFVIAAIDDADQRRAELQEADVSDDQIDVLFDMSRGKRG